MRYPRQGRARRLPSPLWIAPSIHRAKAPASRLRIMDLTGPTEAGAIEIDPGVSRGIRIAGHSIVLVPNGDGTA